jgi:hypothetical protein
MYITTLYGCDSWSFTLRDENGLRMLEKMVLSKTFWSKRGEVKKNWRKLYNEEL